jgi:hypothetical protein
LLCGGHIASVALHESFHQCDLLGCAKAGREGEE